VQIVGYDTAARDAEPPDNHPALHIANDGHTERIPLTSGTELEYTLHDRHCAGHHTDGTHHPCRTTDAPYCHQHTSTWACARCTGDCNLPLDACTDEHAIYLAAFAPDVFKVGVTKPWRLERRLREQGADKAAHLRTVANGRVAREIEAEIATDIGDRVRVPTKMRGFHETVDDDAWSDVLAAYEHEDTFEFDYGLGLTDRPMPETVATGTVVGAKGRVLVLENGGTTYAVDLRDLVGYDIEDEGSDRELQSSLGAFG